MPPLYMEKQTLSKIYIVQRISNPTMQVLYRFAESKSKKGRKANATLNQNNLSPPAVAKTRTASTKIRSSFVLGSSRLFFTMWCPCIFNHAIPALSKCFFNRALPIKPPIMPQIKVAISKTKNIQFGVSFTTASTYSCP